MSLAAALDLLDQMPEAPRFKPLSFDPPQGHFWCACRKKAVPLPKMQFHRTKFLTGVTDSLCAECLPMVRGMATIVCIRCKSVVARMQPVKFPTGFKVAAGEFYHTNSCPICNPNVQTSVLIEKHFYDKENGFPVKSLT